MPKDLTSDFAVPASFFFSLSIALSLSLSLSISLSVSLSISISVSLSISISISLSAFLLFLKTFWFVKKLLVFLRYHLYPEVFLLHYLLMQLSAQLFISIP